MESMEIEKIQSQSAGNPANQEEKSLEEEDLLQRSNKKRKKAIVDDVNSSPSANGIPFNYACGLT